MLADKKFILIFGLLSVMILIPSSQGQPTKIKVHQYVKVINAIRSNNFSYADEKLENLRFDSSIINKVVQNICPIKGGSNMLISYANASNQTAATIKVLSALWHQMQLNHYESLEKFLSIYKVLHEKIINNSKLQSVEIKSDVLNFTETTMRPKIVNTAVNILKESLLNNSYDNNRNIHDKIDLIDNVSHALFDEIIGQAIDRTYFLLPKKKLVHSMSSHSKISQNIIALLHINEIVQQHLMLDPEIFVKAEQAIENDEIKNKIVENFIETTDATNSILLLSYEIFKMKKMAEFENLSEIEKSKITHFINTLPPSVRNLYFNDGKICLRNVHFLEYLQAPVLGMDKLYIYTSTRNATSHQEAKWYAKPIDDFEFQFESMYSDELLCDAPGPDGDVTIDSEKSKKSIWKLSLNGNELTMINTGIDPHPNRYLCAHRHLNIENRRPTYTQRYSHLCRWVVEGC